MTEPLTLTDGQIFAKVTARAIYSVVFFGVATGVVIIAAGLLPRIIGAAAAILLIVYFFIAGVFAIWTTLLGLVTAVTRPFVAPPKQPLSPGFLGAAQGVKIAEVVIYFAYGVLLYTFVLAAR